MKKLLLLASHLGTLGFGFALGVYMLPILIEPDSPRSVIQISSETSTVYKGSFERERIDSDFFHWGEGTVYVSNSAVTFVGKLAPGPDYKLYLSPQFVETEADFNRLKGSMIEVGEIKTFENFKVELSEDVDVAPYNTVIVWCETFGEFITSAQFR